MKVAAFKAVMAKLPRYDAQFSVIEVPGYLEGKLNLNELVYFFPEMESFWSEHCTLVKLGPSHVRFEGYVKR